MPRILTWLQKHFFVNFLPFIQVPSNVNMGRGDDVINRKLLSTSAGKLSRPPCLQNYAENSTFALGLLPSRHVRNLPRPSLPFTKCLQRRPGHPDATQVRTSWLKLRPRQSLLVVNITAPTPGSTRITTLTALPHTHGALTKAKPHRGRRLIRGDATVPETRTGCLAKQHLCGVHALLPLTNITGTPFYLSKTCLSKAKVTPLRSIRQLGPPLRKCLKTLPLTWTHNELP